jgi:hypothetical protein
MGIDDTLNSKPNDVDLTNLIRSMQRLREIRIVFARQTDIVTAWTVVGAFTVWKNRQDDAVEKKEISDEKDRHYF